MKKENKFYTEEPEQSYKDLVNRLQTLDKTGYWIYRGQASKWELETTLERYCNLYRYPLTDAPGIEVEMIRNFQRLYNGEDREEVLKDKLYCISLMRHYGAPSRLLDFTYSKDIAVYFGIECAFDNVPMGKNGWPDYAANRSLAIWCVNWDYVDSRIEAQYSKLYQNILSRATNDSIRDDSTFEALYMQNKYTFVESENPMRLHQRLDIQGGVFLCPGNVARSFIQNLSCSFDDNSKSNIIKLTCDLSPTRLRELLENFRNKNITRQSLIPGLDGFAQSMKYKLALFKKIYESREKSRKKLENIQSREKAGGLKR